MNRNYRIDNNATQQTNEFVNPYNFVSLPDSCNKTVDAFANLKSGIYSGTISCKLETLTPLFIPNTTSDSAFPFAGKAYDFFSYEDLSEIQDCTDHFAMPIIPGSSIRGAIRSAFEAVTNSCLSTSDDEDLVLHRRTTVPKTKYGILVKSGSAYVLHEAEKVMLNTAAYHGKRHTYGISVTRRNYAINVGGVDRQAGDTVYIDSSYNAPGVATFATGRGYQTSLYGVLGISATPGPGYIPGVLFLGERFQNKHHDAVFIRSTTGTAQTISSDDYDRFFQVWKQYQIDSPGSYPNYIDLAEIPVYYENVGPTLYITPACISKEVFDAKISALLRHHSPCVSAKEKICPACALFGLISEDIGGTLASRIMFKDAVPVNFDADNPKDFYEDPRQLPILGSPKISATEFYTEDYTNRYKVWNYDYGIRVSDRKAEHFTPKLRGRKFYWHSRELTPHGAEDRADLTAKIRAVKANKSFSFEIAFERLTKDELDSLLWTLTFGDRHSVNAHKLGHGKPVGYGSVRYRVDMTTKYSLTDELILEPSEYSVDLSAARIANTAPSDYLKLTDYENAPSNISYPIGTRGGDSGVYQWFGINKGGMNNPEYKQVLASPAMIMPDAPVSVITSIEAAFRQAENAEQTVRTDARTKYTNLELQRAQKNFESNKTYRQRGQRHRITLEQFVADYEANPEYYKDLKGRYESIKKTLSKYAD